MLAQQRVVVLPHWLETPVGRLISGSRRPSDLQITQASSGSGVYVRYSGSPPKKRRQSAAEWCQL